jgi:hypothetical protein
MPMPPLPPPGPPGLSEKPPGKEMMRPLTSIVPLMVMSPRDSKARGNAPVPVKV